MADAPKRPCLKAGCPRLVDSGWCQDHAAVEKSQRNRWRGSAHSRGYGRAHQKVRAETMKRDCYLCQRCLEQGRTTPATDSHHVKKLATHPDLHLEPSNRRSLCRECHEIEEKESA